MLRIIFRNEMQQLSFTTADHYGRIPGEGLGCLQKWLTAGTVDEEVRSLFEVYPFLPGLDEAQRGRLATVIAEILDPERGTGIIPPREMQVELTRRCMLECPQCFARSERGRLGGLDLDPAVLLRRLEEFASIGGTHVSLSGGEPLLYPGLIGVIESGSKLGLFFRMATSGWGLTRELLAGLRQAGLAGIYLSLNGSVAEIHRESREGFAVTLEAMGLLRETQTPFTINWVANRVNISDFPRLAALADQYGAAAIVILMWKPSNNLEGKLAFTPEQLVGLADALKGMRSGVRIGIEPCFAHLKTYLYHAGFAWSPGGCRAGSECFALQVDGSFSPCRHMEGRVGNGSLKDYWENDPYLMEVREAKRRIGAPCRDCRYHPECLPCLGGRQMKYGQMWPGETECAFFEDGGVKEGVGEEGDRRGREPHLF